jgi:hypothetical protein
VKTKPELWIRVKGRKGMLFKKKPRFGGASFIYGLTRLIATSRQTNIGRILKNEHEVNKKTTPAKITEGITILKMIRKESLIRW